MTGFENIKKNFGFGCMRLPMDGEKVDYTEFCKMVDLFMAEGFNYFDTARVYIGGQSAGVMLLPMYLPIVLGGCLLGSGWGAAVGLISPVISFVITSAVSSPMPAAVRLPFMMAELCIFAAVSGLFSEKIAEKPLLAFPAVLSAALCGRGFFLLSVTLLARFTPFTSAMIWGQIKAGLPGLLIQALVVPAAVYGLNKLLKKEK